jgi:hypothetical protein
MEVLEDLNKVEIILGRDTATQEVFVIFGRKRLVQIARDHDIPSIDVLMIDLDRHSDQLNQVLALVQLAKNDCDYSEGA